MQHPSKGSEVLLQTLLRESLKFFIKKAINLEAMRSCTTGSMAGNLKSWSSWAPPTIRDLSTWWRTRFTQEVEVPLRSSLVSRQKVEVEMEVWDSEKWREIVWYLMVPLDSWKSDSSMSVTVIASTFVSFAASFVSAISLSNASNVITVRTLRTFARSWCLMPANFCFKSSWLSRSLPGSESTIENSHFLKLSPYLFLMLKFDIS